METNLGFTQRKIEIESRIQALKAEKTNLLQDIKSLRASVETDLANLENEAISLHIEKKNTEEPFMQPEVSDALIPDMINTELPTDASTFIDQEHSESQEPNSYQSPEIINRA